MAEGINVKCEKCGKKLSEPGALIFSPPKSGFITTGDNPRFFTDNITKKYHICSKCWDRLLTWIFEK